MKYFDTTLLLAYIAMVLALVIDRLYLAGDPFWISWLLVVLYGGAYNLAIAKERVIQSQSP